MRIELLAFSKKRVFWLISWCWNELEKLETFINKSCDFYFCFLLLNFQRWHNNCFHGKIFLNSWAQLRKTENFPSTSVKKKNLTHGLLVVGLLFSVSSSYFLYLLILFSLCSIRSCISGFIRFIFTNAIHEKSIWIFVETESKRKKKKLYIRSIHSCWSVSYSKIMALAREFICVLFIWNTFGFCYPFEIFSRSK